MKPYKICVITGSRAEYGLLKPLIASIQSDPDLILQLIVTGMHLSSEFGFTYQEIENDGFPIEDKIEILVSADTSCAIAKSMGLGLIGFADSFKRLKPDMIVLLGDRFEIFAAASTAMVFKIPLAHIHGGEATIGLIDEAIRHSITKMSFLHFTSTELYRQRVIQLGESPDRVFYTGAPGVEAIHKTQLLPRNELEHRLSFSFDGTVVLVTYHPVTLENNTAREQFQNLLAVLDSLPQLRIIFTKANADMNGRSINTLIEEYERNHPKRCVAFSSMGQLLYWSALKYCSLVVGNSSSGIVEVPSFHIPSINIGNRQSGRIKAASVINCGVSIENIKEAIEKGLSKEFQAAARNVTNPYDKKDTTQTILNTIKRFLNTGENLVIKEFYDLEVGGKPKKEWI